MATIATPKWYVWWKRRPVKQKKVYASLVLSCTVPRHVQFTGFHAPDIFRGGVHLNIFCWTAWSMALCAYLFIHEQIAMNRRNHIGVSKTIFFRNVDWKTKKKKKCVSTLHLSSRHLFSYENVIRTTTGLKIDPKWCWLRWYILADEVRDCRLNEGTCSSQF